MAPRIDAVIGLGANLGQPLTAFEFATQRLAALSELVGYSKLYASAALGPEQPDFTNAAVRVHFDGGPHALLDIALEIEKAFGRQRSLRWGPRTLDLDLLWIRGVAVDTPTLKVPHPRLLDRAFALLPLLDVAPEARRGDVTLKSVLPRVRKQRIQAWSRPPSPWNAGQAPTPA